MLLRGLPSRPVVAAIVHVEAVDHLMAPEPCRLANRPAVDLHLAEVAAVHRVGRVARVADLGRIDEPVPGAELFREPARGRALLRREARGDRGQGHGPRTQDPHRLGQQVARIDAAGEADDHPVEIGQQAAEMGDLGVGGRHRVIITGHR